MKASIVSIIAILAGQALASPCKPKSVLSVSSVSSVSPTLSTSVPIIASSTSSLALPSATPGSTTTNPGQVCDATANLFVDGDIASADLPSWPHNVTQGSPTFTRSTNCSIYPACIDVGLVVGGGAQDIAFFQSLTVVSGASYTGHFFYRMVEFTASGTAMATLKCTANGVTKFTKTLCEGEQSADWKQVSFAVTPDSADLVFQCKVSTAAVGAEFQFSDFVMNENC